MVELYSEEIKEIFKILLIGESQVGKTSLLCRFTKGTLPKSILPTIGIEFACHKIMKNNEIVKTQLWDTAGMEKYRSMIFAHFRKARGALLVYDVTKRSTFDKIPYWIKEVTSRADEKVVIMIIGNKIDICKEDSSKRQVGVEEGKKVAEENNAIFFEISVIDNFNVQEAFECLIQAIYDRSMTTPEKSGTPTPTEKKEDA